MIIELNHSLEVCIYYYSAGQDVLTLTKELIRANACVRTAAELSTKYRKNVQYNMEATKLRGAAEETVGSERHDKY